MKKKSLRLKLAPKVRPQEYPVVPEWLHVGSKCSVVGEGTDEFTVVSLHGNGALLEIYGTLHGMEPYEKILLPGVN